MLLLTPLSLNAGATLQRCVRSEIIGFSDEQNKIHPSNLCNVYREQLAYKIIDAQFNLFFFYNDTCHHHGLFTETTN